MSLARPCCPFPRGSTRSAECARHLSCSRDSQEKEGSAERISCRQLRHHPAFQRHPHPILVHDLGMVPTPPHHVAAKLTAAASVRGSADQLHEVPEAPHATGVVLDYAVPGVNVEGAPP